MRPKCQGIIWVFHLPNVLENVVEIQFRHCVGWCSEHNLHANIECFNRSFLCEFSMYFACLHHVYAFYINTLHGQSWARAVRAGLNSSVQSRPNAKVLGWGTEFGQTFLKLGSSYFAQIFSVPRGGGICRGAKKFRNLTRVFRENRGQSTPRSKISTPITPPNGGNTPKQICFYQGA